MLLLNTTMKTITSKVTSDHSRLLKKYIIAAAPIKTDANKQEKLQKEQQQEMQ